MEFPGEWGLLEDKEIYQTNPFHAGGIDIFWKYTTKIQASCPGISVSSSNAL